MASVLAGDISQNGFVVITPDKFSLVPNFITSSEPDCIKLITNNIIAIADYVYEQSSGGSSDKERLAIINKYYNTLYDTGAPMIDLTQMKKLPHDAIEKAGINSPPIPYSHLWKFIEQVFNTVTGPVATLLLNCNKVKILNDDVKLIITNSSTPAQRPHLDATSPSLQTLIYFDTNTADVECTVFRKTSGDDGRFGAVEQLQLHEECWDDHYSLSWTDDGKHPVLSPRKVPNATISIAANGVIHNAPHSATTGKRYVIFFVTTDENLHFGSEDTFTNEITYAYERYKDNESNHHLIAEACARGGDEWTNTVHNELKKKILNIISKQCTQ
jgi:hypothetical protein